MKQTETDIALLINFDYEMRSYYPLGSTNVLMDPDFPIPISIMFGEYDWMQGVDQGFSKKII